MARRKKKKPVDKSEACRGVCCWEQESPPGYLLILRGMEWPDREDIERFATIPAAARDELQKYSLRLPTLPPGDEQGLCIWFDRDACNCRWYEHRPEICRAMEVGGDACKSWRREYGVGAENKFVESLDNVPATG